MVYRVQKYAGVFPKFGVMNSCFTEDEVEKIIFLEKLMTFDKATVGGPKNELNMTARNSDVAFLMPDENTSWIFERLAFLTSKANYDLFMTDIEFMEALQYTIYNGSQEQYYNWHLDEHMHYMEFNRKISGTLFLTDPEEYEGGDLEIISVGDPDRSEKIRGKKGDIAFFSSSFPHRVIPVTKGVRKSLVFWVSGKRDT